MAGKFRKHPPFCVDWIFRALWSGKIFGPALRSHLEYRVIPLHSRPLAYQSYFLILPPPYCCSCLEFLSFLRFAFLEICFEIEPLVSLFHLRAYWAFSNSFSPFRRMNSPAPVYLAAWFLVSFGAGSSLKCRSPQIGNLINNHPRFTSVSIDVENECRVYKVYLVTYASKTNRADFCTMALSALANGFELNILGRKREDQWAIYGYMEKFRALREFLDLLGGDPQAIIVFADAYDVLFTAGPRALVRRFVRSGRRILISSEKGCCSDWLSTVEAVLRAAPVPCDNTWPLPEIGTATPFMNSGAYVGFQVHSRTSVVCRYPAHPSSLPHPLFLFRLAVPTCRRSFYVFLRLAVPMST